MPSASDALISTFAAPIAAPISTDRETERDKPVGHSPPLFVFVFFRAYGGLDKISR